MKFETKFKICLWRAYFTKGEGMISYGKYLIAFFGLASQDLSTTMLLGLLYVVFSFVFGYVLYNSDFVRAEIEVGNKYNNFVEEMRRNLKKK